jgi:hypothetical protein
LAVLLPVGTAICFGQTTGEGIERKEMNLSDNRCSFRHEIPETVRVRTERNSGRIDGSIEMGPNAIRGRFRELENILVLVQIKDENWTKHKSNVSKHFSYLSTDIDPPIIAHRFPSLGGSNDDNGSCLHRVCPLIKIARNRDCGGDDSGEKKSSVVTNP